MADQLNANLSRFSAYKAAHIEKAFNDILNDPKFNDEQRRVAVRAAEEKFARWTDAEYNTATARCITAEQFAEFNDPEHTSLFPNLEWLATRSTNPREEHQAFVGLILPKNHDFWRTHTPGTEWNCKCDLAETDDPATKAANLPTANVPKGLEGNPFYTGEVFTDKVGYLRNAAPTAWKDIIKPMAREVIRQQNAGFNKTFDTSIGKVLVDDITIDEVSKGSATDESYFLKQEVARNIDRYIDKLQKLNEEPIDLSHNNKKKKFYKRKQQLEKMMSYSLEIETQDYKGDTKTFRYEVKIGKFKDSQDLNLYTING